MERVFGMEEFAIVGIICFSDEFFLYIYGFCKYIKRIEINNNLFCVGGIVSKRKILYYTLR